MQTEKLMQSYTEFQNPREQIIQKHKSSIEGKEENENKIEKKREIKQWKEDDS